MKKLALILMLTATIVGCRKEDFRQTTVVIPGLTNATTAAAVESARARIRAALAVYEGVDLTSLDLVTNAQPPRLTLRFDSLKLAEMNIVKAIEEAGWEVTYPELKKGAPAGYINQRKPEVK